MNMAGSKKTLSLRIRRREGGVIMGRPERGVRRVGGGLEE
jgi:hypothetical protein